MTFNRSGFTRTYRNTSFRLRSSRSGISLGRYGLRYMDSIMRLRLNRMKWRCVGQMRLFLRVVRVASRLMSLPYIPSLRGLHITSQMRRVLNFLRMRKWQFSIMHEKFVRRLLAMAMLQNNPEKNVQDFGLHNDLSAVGYVPFTLRKYRTLIANERTSMRSKWLGYWQSRLQHYRHEIIDARNRGRNVFNGRNDEDV